MKWSWLVGRFWGTELRLHASLLLLIPYALLAFKPDSLPGALRVLALVVAIFVCVALHEIGHTTAARFAGIHVTSIVLWPLGGFANLTRRPDKALPDVLISAAGPLVNLLIFLLLGTITAAVRMVESSLAFPEVTRLLWSLEAFPFLLSLTIANLSLALFNLAPIYPLDGGQIARRIFTLLFGEKRADLAMLVISLPLALGLVALGLALRDLVVALTGLLLVLGGISLNLRLSNGIMMGVLYFLDRGGFYLKRTDYDPAIREYTRTIQRSPNRAGLYISRAAAYMNLLQIQPAVADIDQALVLDAESHLAWALRGELLGLQKQYFAALSCYDHALRLNPTWATGYVDRGSLRQEMGDLPGALQDLDRSVALGHSSPVAALIRSILRYQMGDRAGAEADANEAQRYAPQWMLVFPEVFLPNLTGHLEWALAYYWKAIQRMPNAYQAYQGRADACRVNERPAWAAADYSRAIQLVPRLAELYLSRGLVYQQLGEREKAAADYRQVLALAVKSHHKRQAQENLAALAQPAAAQRPTNAGSSAFPAPGEPAEPPGDTA